MGIALTRGTKAHGKGDGKGAGVIRKTCSKGDELVREEKKVITNDNVPENFFGVSCL